MRIEVGLLYSCLTTVKPDGLYTWGDYLAPIFIDHGDLQSFLLFVLCKSDLSTDSFSKALACSYTMEKWDFVELALFYGYHFRDESPIFIMNSCLLWSKMPYEKSNDRRIQFVKRCKKYRNIKSDDIVVCELFARLGLNDIKEEALARAGAV